ncbi:MAG: 2-oxoacid:acceptor oxidoreductase family protein [Chloroflexi bacterium]|nr:2-oxoacid:acceptor oxidoreductase family protein [Chloroflexota bacterium]
MLALAAIAEGQYAMAFPSFGPERRGAPVQAFIRTDVKPVRIRAEIREPDFVVVFETRLLSIVDVTSGLKDKGTIIINSKLTPAEIRTQFGYKWKVATVDATSIRWQNRASTGSATRQRPILRAARRHTRPP